MIRPKPAFDHITDICSVDYPDDPERFEVIYQLLSLPHRRRIRLKARLAEDNPTIASVTDIWKGANFMEREVYDLMGITVFRPSRSAPDSVAGGLRKRGYPLRKDFPTEGKGWRSSFPFIPRLDEPPVGIADGEISEQDKQPFLADPTAAGLPHEEKNCC